MGLTALPGDVGGLAARRIKSIMHPEDLPRVEEHLQRLGGSREGETLEVEYRLRDAKDQWHWISSRDTVFTRAADLCRQMLAYSGKGRFVLHHVNPSEVVRDMASLLEVSTSKSAELRYRFAEIAACQPCALLRPHQRRLRNRASAGWRSPQSLVPSVISKPALRSPSTTRSMSVSGLM